MDYPVVILTGSIIVLGLLVVGSASVDFSQVDYTSFQEMSFFGRLLHLDFGAIANQLVGMIIGIIGMGFILSVDFEDLRKISKYLYIFNIVMLVAVLLLGFTALGAQRWIGIGSFKFQPSELSKIIMIICFADYLAGKEGNLSRWRDLLSCYAFAGFPALLIIVQPDLGTALVLVAITFGMLFVAGARFWHLFTTIAVGVFLILAIYFSHSYLHNSAEEWENQKLALEKIQAGTMELSEDNQDILEGLADNDLTEADLAAYYDLVCQKEAFFSKWHEKFHSYTIKEYQMTRIETFLNPESDLLGSGYNVYQSKISLGSGGFWGKGILEGTQSHFFLPIRTSDFIFSVLGEESGLLGVITLLALYLLLIIRCIRISFMGKDAFGTLLVIGVVSKLSFHIIENIGMSMGLMPVAGIPLPFVSYGGTAMVANLLAIGLVLNVYIHRQKSLF